MAQVSETALKCASRLRASDGCRIFTLAVRDIATFEQQLAAIAPEARVVHRYAPAGVLLITCPSNVFWQRVLPLPEVYFADRGDLLAQPERAVPGHDLSVNHIRAVDAYRPELDGRGTVVSVKEWRFDSTDADLHGRVLLSGLSAPQTTVHATLIATLIGGAGTSDPRARGVARGVQLLSSSFIGLLPDADEDYTLWNVSVQSHAYGTDIENYYGAGALAYDASALRHPELLHVLSAGNLGQNAPPSGNTYEGIEGWANLTGQFKMAKNALVVGATDTLGRLQPFSSRGPTYDGRIKPDLVAYGPNGTSEAAALVAGTAAIVRQCLWEQRQLLPTSDLVRAVLLAACDDADAPGPDFSTGYGNLNLERAVAVAQHHSLWQGVLASGQEFVQPIEVPLGLYQLRAVLCWNDPPASPLAPAARVNDLDLTLIGPDGQVWHPWVLNAHPHADSLRLPARRGLDSLNTTELISLWAPAPGTYTLRVSARFVAGSPQPFAVAVHLDTAGRFAWKSPVAGERAVRAQNLPLRWEHRRTESTATLQWRTLPDGSWQPLADSVPLDRGSWNWLLPDTTALAQVRLCTGGSCWASDSFLIAPAQYLRVDVHCPDSVLLRWNAIAPGAQYRLWGLGTRYLEPLLLTTDTTIVLHKALFPNTRFAVSALLHGAETPPSAAPHIGEQGAGCYVRALLALLDEATGHILLTLSLGSAYGVQEVLWEKRQDDGWQMLRRQPPTALILQAEDHAPQRGRNTYRARLRMANGADLSSEIVHVFYAGPTEAHVYPNPAASAQALVVLIATERLPALWHLFDASGRIITTQRIEESPTEMRLPFLPPGLYPWRLQAEGHWVAAGALLIR